MGTGDCLPGAALFGPSALELEPRFGRGFRAAFESGLSASNLGNSATGLPGLRPGACLHLQGRTPESGVLRQELSELCATALDTEFDLSQTDLWSWGPLQTHHGQVLARATSSVAEVLSATYQAALRPHRRPLIMGVLNVTPDSFSDGGRFSDPQRAAAQAHSLVLQGVELLDIGGESSRPGAEPVSESEELDRVLPVLETLRTESIGVPISIDTTKAVVAEQAIAAGASIVNDISAGRFDERMLDVVAQAKAPFILMHMQGQPKSMQLDPRYSDAVPELIRFLRERVSACLQAGISVSKLILDPGIGFGKQLDHNVEILRRLSELRCLGLPLLLGVSRKSFIGHINERWGAAEVLPKNLPTADSFRVGGTAAACFAGVRGGADILRVHDVASTSEAARVAASLVGLDHKQPPSAAELLG